MKESCMKCNKYVYGCMNGPVCKRSDLYNYNVITGHKGNGKKCFMREWRRKHGIKPLYM